MKPEGQMNGSGNRTCMREAVGVFLDAGHLRKALEELLASGFERDELGVLASEHAVQQKLGNIYTRVNAFDTASHARDTAFVENESVEDTLHALTGGLYFVGGTAAAGAVGALVASSAVLGGPLVVAITAAVAVGAVGALVKGIINQSDADYLREQIDQGHVLLFVRRLCDTAREKQAREILSRHAALGVKTFDVPANAG